MKNARDKSLPNERWLPVVGYEGWYEVSDHGRVRRMRGGSPTRVGKILRPGTVRGYKQVLLCRDNQQIGAYVHRLVAAAFIGPCPDGKEVNHIDGNKSGNTPINLEYLTSSENNYHSYRTGLQISMKGENHPQSKLTESDVRTIRRLRPIMTLKELADKHGVSLSTIHCIVTRKSWKHLKEE